MSNLTKSNIEGLVALMDKIEYPVIPEEKKESRQGLRAYRRTQTLKNFYCRANCYYQAKAMLQKIFLSKNFNIAIEPACYSVAQACDYINYFLSQNNGNIENACEAFLNKPENAGKPIPTIVISEFVENYARELSEQYLKAIENVPWYTCNLLCRNGMISQAQRFWPIYDFEGNITLFSNSNGYILSDDRKLKGVFNNLELFRLIDISGGEHLPIINDILNELKAKLHGFVPKIFRGNDSRLMYKVKVALLKEASNRGLLLYPYEPNPPFFSNLKTKDSSKLLKLLKLFNALYVITAGRKDYFDNIAKLVAGIILGSEICKNNRLPINNVMLITANNTQFVREFILSLFLLGVPSDGRQGMDLATYNALVHSKTSKDGLKDSKYYGVTKHTIKELSNENNTGKFLEDRLYSRFLNITDDLTQIKNKEYFIKLLKGEKIVHDSQLLGKQELVSDTSYLFIAAKKNEFKDYDGLSYTEFDLAQNIPEGKRLFGLKTDLSDYEKFFMLTAFAQYGISLLKKEQADIEDSQSSEIDNPLKYFIEKCCEQKEVSDTDKVHEHNSTAIRTLQCAYNNFFGIVAKKYKMTTTWNKNTFLDYGLDVKLARTKCNAIRTRDLSRGYAEKEVLDKGSNANHIMGIIVKPKDEIEKIAHECKDETSSNPDAQPLSKEDFLKLIDNTFELSFDENAMQSQVHREENFNQIDYM